MSTGTLSHKLFRTSVEKGLAPRQFNFTISSETLDRDRDIIKLSAWDFKEYLRNPVVLAAHDHQRLPVGKSVDIGVRGDSLKATVQFPDPGVYDYADTVHNLVAAGFLNAASVGFRSDHAEPNGLGGMTIKKATLLEWSICSIGSNPDAMVERSVPAVMQKWLQSTAHHKEDDMYLDIDDEPYLELKDDDPVAAMCVRMRRRYAELGGEKFIELMAAQFATLGPNASIAQLVAALMEEEVFTPPRSAPGFRHLSQRGQLLYKQACDRRAGYYPYR